MAGRVEYNTFEVDGSDVLNTGLNGASSTLIVYPSLDAIQEVKVLTSNYGAQYGRTASGTVQVTHQVRNPDTGTVTFTTSSATKRSTRAITSTSSTPFRRLPGRLPGRRLEQRLRSIAGRISAVRSAARSPFRMFTPRKDKTYFFFSEEFRLEKTPTPYNQAVPGLKERGLMLTPTGVQQNLQTGPNGTGLPGLRL